MVDLGGYVIVLVEKNGKIKLYGSAAERSDCDEILEINGCSLENASHSEIIEHIHQCIKTRTICLRVKRRASGKIGNSFDSSLVDAFVIGSRAKEHLRTLAKDSNITPKDIAQLSKILSESNVETNNKETKFNPDELEKQKLDYAETNELDSTIKNNSIKDNQIKKNIELKREKKIDKDNEEIDYYELSDDNMELLNLKTDSKILEKSDSQQSIVNIIKKSTGLSLNKKENRINTENNLTSELNKILSSQASIEEAEKYIPMKNLQANLFNCMSQIEDESISNLVKSTNLADLIDIYSLLMQEKYYHSLEIEIEVHNLIQDVISMIQENGNLDYLTIELLEILTKFEFDGLCYAFNYMLNKRKDLCLKKDSSDNSLKKCKKNKGETELIGSSNKNEQTIEPPPIPPLPSQIVSTFSNTSTADHQQIAASQSNYISDSNYQLHNLNNLNSFFCNPLPTGISYNNINNAIPPLCNPNFGEFIPTSNNCNLPMTNMIQINNAFPNISADINHFPTAIHGHFLTQTNSINYPNMSIAYPTSLPTNLSNLPTNIPSNTKLSIVRIEKHSTEHLGATVRNELDGRVTIGRIVCGGAAEKCAALSEGDEILMVNNIYIRGKNVDQVCELLAQMQGTLTFVIAKRESNSDKQINEGKNAQLNTSSVNKLSGNNSNNYDDSRVTHYKAYFNYNPNEDIYIPCRELGLSFRKGDLLHVLDSTDESWWQAYKEGDTEQNLAGLIPSLQFQLMRTQNAQNKEDKKENSNKNEEVNETDPEINKRSAPSMLFNCGKRSASKKRKNKLEEELIIPEYYIPYEKMKQSMNYKRTIVLVGPNNIGRQFFRERLLKQKSIFATAIPHTSRTKRNDEQNGEDYYFVSKQQFEQFILEDKFIEFGDYDKTYYGTAFSSVEDVIKANKTCVLNLHVESINKLRNPAIGIKLKPYFIFIAPPVQIEELRKLTESINNAPMSNNELHSIINEAWDIKCNYAHYFDLILTVTDIDKTYRDLLNEINSLDKEPQWIPAAWLE